MAKNVAKTNKDAVKTYKEACLQLFLLHQYLEGRKKSAKPLLKQTNARIGKKKKVSELELRVHKTLEGLEKVKLTPKESMEIKRLKENIFKNFG